MLSLTKITTTFLLASALLCTSPLAAALKSKSGTTVPKSKPGATARKSKSAASSLHAKSAAPASHAKVSDSRASSGTAAHNSSKGALSKDASPKGASPKSVALKGAVTRSGKHGKVVRVAIPVKPKARGQQSIDQTRTLEIQQALIREHYLDGEATGDWDQATRDALIRFQGDHHWQTKIIPDARALIKLGLGPSQQNLLNPESAAIAAPYRSSIEKSAPGGSN